MGLPLTEQSDARLREWQVKVIEYLERASTARDPIYKRAYIDIANGYSRLILKEETRRSQIEVPGEAQ